MPTKAAASIEPWQAWASSLLTLAVSLALLFASFRPLFVSIPWMTFFEDDFFYYLKVAQNIAHGGGSTFNGIVQTNGYHPLWLLILTCFSVFAKSSRSILIFMGLLSLLSGLSTYYLSRHIFLFSNLGLLPASAFSLVVTVYNTPMLFGGMEVTLTVPLVLLVVLIALQPAKWTTNASASALFGLAVSAMVLSRLDTLILAGLLVLAIIAHREIRSELCPSSIYGFACGLIPVALYFLSNVIFFHTLLPVSGMAKQLKASYAPSAPALRSAFDTLPRDQAIIFFILLMTVALLIPRRYLSGVQRAVYFSVLIFPFLYVGILSCRSDWRLWPWYLYPFRPALCLSLALLGAFPPVLNLLRKNLPAAVLALLALALLPAIRWSYEGRETIYDAAVDLQTFAQTHHGTYAMGDRAGMPAYLLSDPIVQTEGLVMDKVFLEHIKHREPLLNVLSGYKVRYFIASSRQPYPACYHASEPAQAGPASPHMEADLCRTPVATFVYSKYYVAIYDLAPAPQLKP